MMTFDMSNMFSIVATATSLVHEKNFFSCTCHFDTHTTQKEKKRVQNTGDETNKIQLCAHLSIFLNERKTCYRFGYRQQRLVANSFDQ